LHANDHAASGFHELSDHICILANGFILAVQDKQLYLV
jgi:hypothetical protein